MLWKVIKTNAIKFCLDNPHHAGVQELVLVARAAGRGVVMHLMAMEYLHADELRQYLPEVFPRKLRKKPLIASKNIHGEWRIDSLTSIDEIRELLKHLSA